MVDNNGDEGRLTSFSLTLVEYERGDNIGLLMALLSLAPIFAVVMYTTLVCSRRDIRTVAMLLGQLLNVVLNEILKVILVQERPSGYHEGYGMPSNHAQFVGFFMACWLSHLLARWPYVRKTRKQFPWDDFVLIVGTLMVGSGTCVSRIYLNYHTPMQVIVGLFVGTGFGTFWERFVIRQFLVPRVFTTLLQSTVGQTFFLRDLTAAVNDSASFEYDALVTSSTGTHGATNKSKKEKAI